MIAVSLLLSSEMRREPRNSVHVLVTLLVCSALEGSPTERLFNGYSLFKVTPVNMRQMSFLQHLARDVALFEGSPIEFWKFSTSLNESFQLMLSPLLREPITSQMVRLGFSPELLISDLEQVIAEQKVSTRLRGREDQSGSNESLFFDNYHSLVEIYSFIDSLQRMNPEISTIDVIGQSYENRDLKVLRIGNSNAKPIVWVDGGTHAREWIGSATVLYMAYQVAAAKQSCDNELDCPAEMHRLLNSYDFYFLPMLNPDGFEFTHVSDRLWRKTRSDSEVTPWNIFCKGTDPNRNYDAQWGGAGSSGNPCSQTYAGKTPHSEKEVKSTTDYVLSLKNRIKLFISLHSYSQIMLLPYGYSADVPKEYDQLEQLAIIGAEALKAKYGTEYRIGSSARILYAASGTASDWAFESAGIKYSYTFELPDTGDKGFLLPPERIRPVGEETWAAVKAMALNVGP